MEESPVMRMKVLIAVRKALEMCIFANKRKELEEKKELDGAVMHFAVWPVIKDCSQNCHKQLDSLHFGSEDAQAFLDQILNEGIAQQAEAKAKLSMKKGKPVVPAVKADSTVPTGQPTPAVQEAINRKRKREDDNEDGAESDEPPAKRQKMGEDESKAD